ncbi:MAG: N-acetylmuramidase domain-containing protein, partial [Acidimicrobiia bacterium]
VLTVETHGFGFLTDRRPQILFERHIFSKLTNGKFDGAHPAISNRNPGGYKGGADEYTRLAEAMQLDQDAALESASWGLAQVMGFNCKAVGYASVQEMINTFVDNEDSHLEAMANFIISKTKCRMGIQRQDWGSFAACYNGSNFRINNYDVRLAAAFAKNKVMIPDIGLRASQVALAYLDFDPGPIDGFTGRRTHGALSEFQQTHGLTATGALNDETEDKLITEAFG